jgi:hypothetical protein
MKSADSVKFKPPLMFAIGSRHWPGLSKLAEEAGELTHVIGQILDSEKEPPMSIQEQFTEELGDLLAACAFVAEANSFPVDEVLVHSRVANLLFQTPSGEANVFTKLAQVLGKAMQVIGKLMGTGGEVNHWDGTNLRDRLEYSLSELIGAGTFAAKVCEIEELVEARKQSKMVTFRGWHIDGLNSA